MLVGRKVIEIQANTRRDNTSLTFQGLRAVLVGSFGRCAMGERVLGHNYKRVYPVAR